jgi:hypothetical protein
VRPLPTHRTTQTQIKRRQTSLSRVRFEFIGSFLQFFLFQAQVPIDNMNACLVVPSCTGVSSRNPNFSAFSLKQLLLTFLTSPRFIIPLSEVREGEASELYSKVVRYLFHYPSVPSSHSSHDFPLSSTLLLHFHTD